MIKKDNHHLNNSIAFMTAVILTVGVIFCLSFIRNELDLAAIAAKYNFNVSDFVAEKSEKLQYIFGTLAFPIFYAAAQLFLNKKSFSNHKFEHALDWCGFILIILLTFAVIINTPLLFYILAYLPTKDNYIYVASTYILSCLPLIITLFLFILLEHYERVGKEDAASFDRNCLKKRLCDAAIYVVAAANLIFVPYLYITKTYYYNQPVSSTPFDAYFYPVYKVFCGQTPLVDFDNLYGFYPYFLVPLFKLTGGISMLRFSVVMSFLVFIIILAMTIIIFKICTNKYLALLGTLAFSFTVAVLPMLYKQVYYLQYFPHRVLFPVLILFLCVMTVRMKSEKALKCMTFAGYAVSVLSLLWNLDTGIVVLSAFAGFRFFLLLQKYKFKEKGLYQRTTGILLCTILCVAAYLSLLIFITYERSGKLLNVDDVLYSQTSFYGAGYYMLRMPLLAPWLLLVILYAFYLAKALRSTKFLRYSPCEPINEKTVLRILLPVIGMGIFSYYQGRSHYYVLLAVIWPGIIALVMMLDEYWQTAKEMANSKNRSLSLEKSKFFAVFCFMAIFVSSYLIHAISPVDLQRVKNKVHYPENTEISPIINTIHDVRVHNEPIDLITYHSAAIYCILGDTRTANVPATIDWFTKADYQRVFDYLAQTKNKVIIDKGSMDCLQKYEPEKLKSILARFTVIEQAKDCSVYIKK